jgi:hypothetical protein
MHHRSAYGRSAFKGVSLLHTAGSRNPWRSEIVIDHKKRYLGNHPTEEAAALAYDRAALAHYGPDAKLNFPAPEIGAPIEDGAVHV